MFKAKVTKGLFRFGGPASGCHVPTGLGLESDQPCKFPAWPQLDDLCGSCSLQYVHNGLSKAMVKHNYSSFSFHFRVLGETRTDLSFTHQSLTLSLHFVNFLTCFLTSPINLPKQTYSWIFTLLLMKVW